MHTHQRNEHIRCYRIHKKDERGQITSIPLSSLTSGEVHIQVRYSSVNYKDALAGLAVSPILKKYPLNGGIDCGGVVLSSLDKNFQPGQEVLVHGCSLSEWSDGGYAEQVYVKPSCVISKPEGLTLRECMIIGTAGFTAALCLLRMSRNGQNPNQGPILITGATGGVGSLATQLFSHLGYEVWAITGKKDKHDFLKSLGAEHIYAFEDLHLENKPLAKGLFAGVIDNLGGDVLEQLVPHIKPWGNVASVGLARGPSFSTTVMPFILRGVSLLGVSSNNCCLSDRQLLWQKLGSDWKLPYLKETLEIGLDDLNKVFQQMLDRKTYGRILVNIAG